jgi:hypothetical protein
MSLTLVVTASAANANSYVTLASANNFLEQNIHISATWASLTTANAEASLIYATTLLDAQMDWLGVKGSSAQALRWPRTDVSDPDEYAVDSDTIPVFLQEATSFYAYNLSQSDRTAESDTLGFTRLDAGSLRMDIDKYDRRETMPVSVYDLIKHYGSRASGRSRVLIRR